MFNKLTGLNPAGRGRLVEGHFLSPDGRETLLLIETPVSITDFAGAEKLYAELDRVLRESLPPSVKATAVSGHLYTIANARAIQRDLKVVLSASLLALLLIYLVFFRRLQALLVFLLPLALLGPALALAGFFSPPLSAITVGFGAVLLGIAIDYGLHLYFALQTAPVNPARTVAALAVPLSAAALTSVCALSVQLFSSLPGQRQLALFAGSGLLLALLLALLLLPHFLGLADEPRSRSAAAPGPDFSRLSSHASGRRLVVLFWGLGLLACAGFAGRVGCVGDLREVNLVPAELKQAEKELAENWGELRGRALVVARGDDLESALAAEDLAYEKLRQVLPREEIMSLAPVLPATATQANNQAAWAAFWRQRLPALRRDLAAAARRSGFAETAFAPFFAALANQPPPLTPGFWRRAGCGPLLDVLLTGEGGPDDGPASGGFSLLSLVPDRPVLAALFPASSDVLSGELTVNDSGAALHLVSPVAFSDRLSLAIAGELKRFIGLALVVVSLILLLWLRRPYQALLALLPVLAGLLTMFGIMGALGLSFNLFNLVAAILLIGLGVDYGIFMVYRLYRGHSAATEKAVLVSALTTLAGFGVLILARHPALNSIGLTVFLGVIGALPTVLFILP
ncbi:MAG: MMPL family transporter, partial [Deltaproteobacteria bacterium]|nr:MMPL family transporter [Deltaproteobacteria bacterium]